MLKPITQKHVGYFQLSYLPPLTLCIKFIDIVNRVHHENGVIAEMYLLFEDRFYLKGQMRILADGIGIIQKGL